MFMREQLLASYFQRDLLAETDQLFAALTRTVARVNQSGATLDEPAAVAYARVGIPLNSTNWAQDGFGGVYNTIEVDFPAPVAGEDWGYLGGWALLDSPDSGITLAADSLVNPLMYTSDMPPLAIPPQGIMLVCRD
jgi:hypothetical protein